MSDPNNQNLTQPRCPSCGRSPVSEFTEPSGVGLCLHCGSLVRRTARGLVVVGMSADSLSRLVHARLGGNVDLDRVESFVRARVAEKLGREPAAVNVQADFIDNLGADSLDVVEIVMAVEEQFGVQLGAS